MRMSHNTSKLFCYPCSVTGQLHKSKHRESESTRERREEREGKSNQRFN